jgi:hypothetical protein
MRCWRSAQRQDLNRLVRMIEEIGHGGGRTSAVRVFMLLYFRAAANASGHEAVNHGSLDRASMGHPARHAA